MEAQRHSHLYEDTHLKYTLSIVKTETNPLVLPHVGSLDGFGTGTLREKIHLLINLNKCWSSS